MNTFKCPRCGRLHVEIEDDISPYTEYTCGGCGKKFLVNTCIIKDGIAETIPVTEPLESEYFYTDDYEPDYSKMISCDDTVPMKKKEIKREVEKSLEDNGIEVKEMPEEQKKYFEEYFEDLFKESVSCIDGCSINPNQNTYNFVVQCKEIHLTKDKVDITIDNERVKQFDSITIDGIKFVREK